MNSSSPLVRESVVGNSYGRRSAVLISGFVLLVSVLSFGSAGNVYVANAAAGAADGSSCANARASSYFSSAGNWGAGATQIGADTVVHLCGTITGPVNSTGLSFQGSGTTGHPVTVLFETGAIMTSAAWGVAINLNTQSNVVVDGGANGIIRNTANGTGLANSIDSVAIDGGPSACGSNVEIKNLSMLNMYVRTSGSSDPNGGGSGGASLTQCGDNILIHHNTSTQGHANIFLSPGGHVARSNYQVYNNTTVGATWGIVVATDGTNTISNISVHDNDVSDGSPWDDPADVYHKDGIFMFGVGSGNGTGSLSHARVYNNYIHGVWGPDHATAFMYINENVSFIDIFNNLFIGGGTTNGMLTIGGCNAATCFRVLNNTFVASGPTSGATAFGDNSVASINNTFKNNIVSNINVALYPHTATFSAIDRNDYFNISAQFAPAIWCTATACTEQLSTWRAAGFDVNGLFPADPKLDPNYHPQAGSAAIGLGENLTSLGIAALNVDKAGVARPSSGPWDAGAYMFGQAFSSAPPLPPSNLTAIVQ